MAVSFVRQKWLYDKNGQILLLGHHMHIRYRRPTLYHAQVLLLPLRPRGVRMQSPPRAADTPLAQPTRALKPIVERGGKRLVRVRVGVGLGLGLGLGLGCWAWGKGLRLLTVRVWARVTVRVRVRVRAPRRHRVY